MKKKLCMVCLLAAFLTAGCTQNGQEPAPEDEDVMTLPDEEQADEETKEEQKEIVRLMNKYLDNFKAKVDNIINE